MIAACRFLVSVLFAPVVSATCSIRNVECASNSVPAALDDDLEASEVKMEMLQRTLEMQQRNVSKTSRTPFPGHRNLFERSEQVLAPVRTIKRQSLQPPAHDFSDWVPRVDETEVLPRFVSKAGKLQTGQPLPDVPKVAFLFLVKSDLQHPGVWERFFLNAPKDLYSIYVHQAANDTTSPIPLAKYGAIAVPWVPTAWCALFGAEVALLSSALEDQRNTQFVFESDSTIPLKRFGYVYNQLVESSPTTSKFCLASPVEADCSFRDVLRAENPRTLKHHQWVVLARDHSISVVRQAVNSYHLYVEAVGSGGNCCSDETMPLTAILYDIAEQFGSTGDTWGDLTSHGVEQRCLTYVLWKDCFVGSNFHFEATSNYTHGWPFEFHEIDVPSLKTMVDSGFMFGRKFTSNATVLTADGLASLEEVLPALWAEADEDVAKKLVWNLTDTAGAPVASS